MCLPHQLLAAEGGLPEPATKSNGLFSSIVIVQDGALLSDTGESRLAHAPPPKLAPYDAKELGLAQQARTVKGADPNTALAVRSPTSNQLSGTGGNYGTPEVLGMSVGFERPTHIREQLEYEGALLCTVHPARTDLALVVGAASLQSPHLFYGDCCSFVI